MHPIVAGRRFASRTYSRTVSRFSSRMRPRVRYRGSIAVNRAQYDAHPCARYVASAARSVPRGMARGTTPFATRILALHPSLRIARVPRPTLRAANRLSSRAALGTVSRTVMGDFRRGTSRGSPRPVIRVRSASFHALLYAFPVARLYARCNAGEHAFLFADDSALVGALVCAGYYAHSTAHDAAM